MNPYEGLCCARALDRLAATHRDRIGLTFGDAAWTFADIRAEVDAAGARLAGLGLPPGAVVALWLTNTPAFLWYWLGAAQAGLLPLVVNTRLTQAEAHYQFAQSGAVAAIVPDGGAPRDHLAELLAMREAPRDGLALDALAHVLALAPDGGVQHVRGTPAGAAVPGRRELDPDAGALVVYTSGTTGLPKGAVLGHRIWQKAWDIARIGRNTADDRLYLGIPLFSSMAMLNGVLPCWVRGGCVRLYPRFDAAECLDLAGRGEIDVLHLLPAMILDMLALGPFRSPPLAGIRIGLALTNDAGLMARAEDELGVRRVVAGYGMTETMTLVARPVPEDPREVRFGTQGLPLPGIEVAIREAGTGLPVPCGSGGEICVRGYTLMRGYLNKPQETQAAFTADGWFRTGDLGRLDPSGRLIFDRRSGDGFKVRGFNVSAPEVEIAISAHPAVGTAAVVGIPDEREGAVGVAFVVLRPGAAATADGLVAFLRERLAGYKVPRHVVFVDGLPLTGGTAKIRKHQLRERAAALFAAGGGPPPA